ncbi:MAG: AraC family transcriptional regulator [Spirochaetales bacterium]|nr:AraC family transcriptional regulator [Spirochaetales bacterium]
MQYRNTLSRFISVLLFALLGITLISGFVLVYKFNSDQHREVVQSEINGLKAYLDLRFQVIAEQMARIGESDEAKELGESKDLQSFYYAHSALARSVINRAPMDINLSAQIHFVVMKDPLYPKESEIYNPDLYLAAKLGLSESQIEGIYSTLQQQFQISFVNEHLGKMELCFFRMYSFRPHPLILFVAIPLEELTSLESEDINLFHHSDPQDEGDRFFQIWQTYEHGPTGISFIITADRYRKKLPVYFLVFFVVCLPVVFLFRWLNRIVTSRLYSPFKSLLDKFEDAGEYQDEFALIDEKFQKIVHQNQNLIQLAEKNKAIVFQKNWIDCIHGTSARLHSDFQARFQGQKFALALILFPNRGALRDEDFIFRFRRSLRENLIDLPHIHVVTVAHDDLLVIFSRPEQTPMVALLESWMLTFDAQNRIQAALSGVGDSLSSLPQLYQSVQVLREFRGDFPDYPVIEEKHTQGLHHDQVYYPLSVENLIIHEALDGNISCMEKMRSILEENSKNRRLTPRTRRRLVFSLMATLHRIQIELKGDESQILDLEELQSQTVGAELDLVTQRVLEALRILVEAAGARRASNQAELKERLLGFIERGYSDNIMLNELADELGLTHQYTSLLFKRVVGDNFKNHLTATRIRHAKKILENEPDIMITDLARRVGFNSLNSFARVFKTQVGVTPKQYVRMSRRSLS